MPTYRWNVSEHAAGYDTAAETIHPYYTEVQEVVIGLLPLKEDEPGLVVDAGGGSGRLVERILEKFPKATAIVVDQSEPFLALAERRLARFGQRAECRRARLQEDWFAELPEQPAAIVSMSAIHHLAPAEKREFYARCARSLRSGGVLVNGDEVRPEDEAEYLALCQEWAGHMRRIIDSDAVPPSIHPALTSWIDRNVTRFGQPRASGDDCHETAAAQLGYLREGGCAQADVPWSRKLWSVLRGVKA
jgi:SAM-dependent methyltransferase